MKKIKLIAVVLIAVMAFSGCQAKDEPATTTKAVTANNNQGNDAGDENDADENDEADGGQSVNSSTYVSETIGIKFDIPDGFSVTSESEQTVTMTSDDTGCIIQFMISPSSTVTFDEIVADSILTNFTSGKYVLDEIPDMVNDTVGGIKWPSKRITAKAMYNDMPVLVSGSFFDPGTGKLVFAIITILEEYVESYTESMELFDATILNA